MKNKLLVFACGLLLVWNVVLQIQIIDMRAELSHFQDDYIKFASSVNATLRDTNESIQINSGSILKIAEALKKAFSLPEKP